MKTTAAVLRTMGAARPYADSRPLSLETVTLDPLRPFDGTRHVVPFGWRYARDAVARCLSAF
ncbi:MAG: hypothetical protein U1E18_20670 [Brevundimonas sp.]|uniref:hypothetical protein n=1 Tax=Brevundimonas sp. TaxID=1871086 RepID=UPI002ABAFCD0|nr:hypothetical protein [Brevundimonas sp.]MDZ4111992.1 hypothetical protein [Brevundimonas sp.]